MIMIRSYQRNITLQSLEFLDGERERERNDQTDIPLRIKLVIRSKLSLPSGLG